MIIKKLPEFLDLRIYRMMLVMISCLFLFACASGQLKKPVRDVVEVETKEPLDQSGYIELESGVESDFDLAVALMESGEYEQAAETLESVIQREPRLVAQYCNSLSQNLKR